MSLEYDEELVSMLRRIYGEELDTVFRALTTPGPRYYIRVNTLKTTRSELIERLKRRGLNPRPDEILEEAIYFPVKGPNRIRDNGIRVIADKRAAESVMMGANLYAPGVVEADPRIRRGMEVTVVAENGVPVAIGIAEMDGGEMAEESRGIAVRTVKSIYKVPQTRELPEYRQGLFYEQSLPAMLTTRVLDPRPGETIVDMCAAPGGKATHAAQITGNNAVIYAIDHSARKTEKMRRETARLGARIRIIRADSRYLHLDYPWLRPDKVILDPPCTALGVRPKLWDSKKGRDVRMTREYQRQFIREAYRVLKPGGIMVYSTCTLTMEENEENIEYMLSLGFKPLEPGYRWGARGAGEYWFRDYLVRFHPHTHPGPGYFIALLEKV